MFRLRRLDVWPTGDLGVRKGYALAWQVPVPTEKQLVPLGEPYRPYRSVVAWYCWRAVQLYGKPRRHQAGERRPGSVTGAADSGFARSRYRHWIPWRVHLGGAGVARCSELPAAPVGSGRGRPPMSELTVGVVRQDDVGERRVALVPESVARLAALGLGTVVQEGAGAAAWFPDAEYAAAGATVVPGPADVRAGRRRRLRPRRRTRARLRAGQLLVGLLQPLLDPGLARALAEAGVTAVSLDGLPRTLSRAQSMDALTSQANVAGYKAALVAADAYGGYFPMLMTAAGTVRPAPGAGARRRRGRPAGDRHRPPARRGRHRLRRARRRPGPRSRSLGAHVPRPGPADRRPPARAGTPGSSPPRSAPAQQDALAGAHRPASTW